MAMYIPSAYKIQASIDHISCSTNQYMYINSACIQQQKKLSHKGYAHRHILTVHTQIRNRKYWEDYEQKNGNELYMPEFISAQKESLYSCQM